MHCRFFTVTPVLLILGALSFPRLIFNFLAHALSRILPCIYTEMAILTMLGLSHLQLHSPMHTKDAEEDQKTPNVII